MGTEDFDKATTTECGPLTLRSTTHGDEQVVAVYGELDLSTREAFDDELRRLEQTGNGRIVVDLSGLRFMDSTGLQAVLHAHARAEADGKRLTFIRAAENVQKVFEVTGTDKLLPFIA